MAQKTIVAEHLTPSDILGSITRPKGMEELKLDQVTNTTQKYNIKGETDDALDDINTAAVKLVLGKGTTYKVKCKRGKKLFDPYVGDTLTQVSKTTKDPAFRLREVSQNSFEKYVQYLKTGYQSLILASEREIN